MEEPDNHQKQTMILTGLIINFSDYLTLWGSLVYVKKRQAIFCRNMVLAITDAAAGENLWVKTLWQSIT
jgi:hypothetical protein